MTAPATRTREVPRWIAVVDEHAVYEITSKADDEAAACSAVAQHIDASRAAWKGAESYEADSAYTVLLVDTRGDRVLTWSVDVEGSEDAGYRVAGMETDDVPNAQELKALYQYAAPTAPAGGA